MIPIAHVGGVPFEELIPAITGAGSALLLARSWVWLHRPWAPVTRPGRETPRRRPWPRAATR